MRRFFNTLLDLIFPAQCLGCSARGEELCQKCLLASPPASRESASWIFPLYDYRHPSVKKAIWLLKYKNKKRIANVFAKVMHERILEELSDLSLLENFHEPILIPIPLSPRRLQERGFNQTLLICEELIKINAGKDFVLEKNILKKPKDTEHQARIEDRKKRLQNIVGSFRVKHPEKIKGKNIILLDDVTTTGATLGEAKKVLKQAGARKIIAFTVAH